MIHTHSDVHSLPSLTSDVAIVIDSEAVSHSNRSVDSAGAILFKSPRQHDNCESNAII